MARRERFARFLHESGSLQALLSVRRHSAIPWLSILTYHRFPCADGIEEFDEDVVDVTAQEFERQVVWLKAHFSIVGVDELCVFAKGGTLPKNPVMITFDDGYSCNYSVAFPILKKHGAKAVFFVATSFITERKLYWWDRIAFILKNSDRPEISLDYPSPLRVARDEPRPAAIRRVLRCLKSEPLLDIDRFLLELSRAAAVSWSDDLERRYSERLLMTWDHLRELRKAGMDVQSHTRTHRLLQTLSPAELVDELAGSRDDLQRELGEAPRALAYPVGRPLEPASPIRAAMKAAGYEVGLTNATGPTSLRKPVDPFDIRRQTVDRDSSEAFLKTILALPELAPTRSWRETSARSSTNSGR